MTEAHTTNQPKSGATYRHVVDQAEAVTADEMAEIVATDDNPDIYRPRRPRIIAMTMGRSKYATDYFYYDYCTRHYGNLEFGVVGASDFEPPVFYFERADRLVKLVKGDRWTKFAKNAR